MELAQFASVHNSSDHFQNVTFCVFHRCKTYNYPNLLCKTYEFVPYKSVTEEITLDYLRAAIYDWVDGWMGGWVDGQQN
jgi:hypothetical protein